ncbi:uncharacterized protein LOC144106471 [Amblyomma americanum]
MMSLDDDAPTPAPSSSWQHYREPRSFAGSTSEDVDEWLTHYLRVSRYNKWNSSARLANVVFSLRDTSLRWYDNHEDSFTTWDCSVEELKKCFGDSVAKKKRAEQMLAQRAQLPGETCTKYIEEIFKLCKVVSPNMRKEDKVGHLLKGFAEDVYNFLIGKESLESMSDVIQHCRTFETLKMRRITPKFGRLARVTTVAAVDISSCDLASTIRQTVREELTRSLELTWDSSALPPVYPTRPPPPVAVIAADFEEHLVPRGLQPSNIPRSPPEHRSRFYHPTPATYDENFRPSPSYDDYLPAQPAADFSLVCYHCGQPGHISRFCPRRRQRQPSHYGSSTYPPRLNYQPASAWYPSYTPDSGNPWSAQMRNRLPASDRSVTPPPALRTRRSPSPRRRSSSPPPEN